MDNDILKHDQQAGTFPHESALKRLVEEYKNRIRFTNNIDETYKWRLIKDFQTKWNEDAEDFKKMFLTINFYNLVYPIAIGVIRHLVSDFPEEMRACFKNLFDETQPLQDRIEQFQQATRQLYDQTGNTNYKTHQDERTIATYLTFHNPLKYTFYKSSFFTKLMKKLEIRKERPGKIYVQYMELVNEFIPNCVAADPDLLQLKNDFLNENSFKDPNNLILAQDILYQTMDQASPYEAKRYWRIGSTAGQSGPSRWAEMRQNSIVSIGWSEIGDLDELEEVSRENIIGALGDQGYYAESPANIISRKAGEIFDFYQNIKKGDIVIVAEGKRVLAIGEVKGEYEHNSQYDFSHYRPVKWILEDVKSFSMEEGLQTAVFPIVTTEYIAFIEGLVLEAKQQQEQEIKSLLTSKNVILFGPPGTGKTYQLKEKLFRHFTNLVSDAVSERYVFTTFHQSLSYEDFVEGIKPEVQQKTGHVAYKVKPGIFKEIADKAAKDPKLDYAIFIDEINRGNVSAIFGELITLIEDDKRKGAAHELFCTLPYSKEKFSVPQNLYIIGTMNTADRSIEALDTALTRRFSLVEMLPQPKAIKNHPDLDVDLPQLLAVINRRLERLLDRDHQIGHSYLMSVADSADPLQELKKVFANKILPLLQEYFYGNYGKIGAILGKGFVHAVASAPDEEIDFAEGFILDEFELKEVYVMAEPLKFNSAEPFKAIYGG
jgi:MoxR-like ATPase